MLVVGVSWSHQPKIQETPWAYWVIDFSVVGIKSQNMLVRCEMPSRSGGLSESLSFQNCE